MTREKMRARAMAASEMLERPNVGEGRMVLSRCFVRTSGCLFYQSLVYRLDHDSKPVAGAEMKRYGQCLLMISGLSADKLGPVVLTMCQRCNLQIFEGFGGAGMQIRGFNGVFSLGAGSGTTF